MSLYELRGLSSGPGIVSRKQMNALSHGWMIEEEKHVCGIGGGINENSFAEFLERNCGRLPGISHDSMCHFQAIDIGLIFYEPAEIISGNFGRESIQRDEQQQSRQSGPIVHAANAPSFSTFREEPTDTSPAQGQENESHRGKKCQALPNVTQSIMPQFVPEGCQDAIGGFRREARVPNHDSL